MHYKKYQLVDFIYNNFKRKNKKLTKKELNNLPIEILEELITQNNCEDRLAEWVKRPKLIKYMAEGIKNGENHSWDCENYSEEDCRKDLESLGVTVTKIVTKRGHHRCKYCGNIADGNDKDLLCNDCHELFGHTFYSEL